MKLKQATIYSVVAAASLGVLLTGCGSSSQNNSASLQNQTVAAKAAANITLQFEKSNGKVVEGLAGDVFDQLGVTSLLLYVTPNNPDVPLDIAYQGVDLVQDYRTTGKMEYTVNNLVAGEQYFFTFYGFDANGTQIYNVTQTTPTAISTGVNNITLLATKPKTQKWDYITATNEPNLRKNATGVWTGKEFIVWGGTEKGSATNEGGAYNPTTKSWSSVPKAMSGLSNFLPSSATQVSVFAPESNLMIVLDYVTGVCGHYNTLTKAWTQTVALPGFPAGGYNYVAKPVWTGKEMVFVGNQTNGGGLSAYKFTPGAPIPWVAFPALGISARTDFSAVLLDDFAKDTIYIYGGFNAGTDFNDIYKLTISNVSLTTIALPPTNVKVRHAHGAVSLGNDMFIFGGLQGNPGINQKKLTDGFKYSTAANTWTPINMKGGIHDINRDAFGDPIKLSDKTFYFSGYKFDSSNEKWTKMDVASVKFKNIDSLDKVSNSTVITSGSPFQQFMWGGVKKSDSTNFAGSTYFKD